MDLQFDCDTLCLVEFGFLYSSIAWVRRFTVVMCAGCKGGRRSGKERTVHNIDWWMLFCACYIASCRDFASGDNDKNATKGNEW